MAGLRGREGEQGGEGEEEGGGELHFGVWRVAFDDLAILNAVNRIARLEYDRNRR